MMGDEYDWKPGLPPGKMTADNKQWFLDTYDVYFSPIGKKWHRKKRQEAITTSPPQS